MAGRADPFSDTDRAIATWIVDAADDTGQFDRDAGRDSGKHRADEIELEEIEAVLKTRSALRPDWRRRERSARSPSDPAFAVCQRDTVD